MTTSYFSLMPTTNIIGVEIAGIIKNIAAILAGILTANNYCMLYVYVKTFVLGRNIY